MPLLELSDELVLLLDEPLLVVVVVYPVDLPVTLLEDELPAVDTISTGSNVALID